MKKPIQKPGVNATNGKRILNACIELAIATVAEGSLFVIDLSDLGLAGYYTTQYTSIREVGGKPLSVFKEQQRMVIKKLAEIDGAVIIDKKGNMIDFGATLKRHIDFIGHGKRHAFALGTSKLDHVVCVLASEEDHHVRTFRDGVCVADIDARTRLPATSRHRILELLNSPVSTTLISAGIATSILTLNPVPAIVTIAGSNVLVSKGFEKIKEVFQHPASKTNKNKTKARKKVKSSLKTMLSILFVLH